MKIKSQKGTPQRLSEVFGGSLGDPLGGRSSSWRLSVLLPPRDRGGILVGSLRVSD